MATIKRIIILYFSVLFALLFISKLFGAQITVLLRLWALWVLPLFAIIAGQFMGYLATLFLKRNHEKQNIYNFSFFLAFTGFVAMATWLKYSYWRHQKDF